LKVPAVYGQAKMPDEPETRREDGMDTGRTDPAVNRLVRILPYRGPESASATDKRLVEAAIRQMYRKRWKRAWTRCEHLIQLRIPKDRAWPRANTRKGYWHTADSRILKHSLTNHYLESIGFPDVLERFEMLHERVGRILKIRALTAAH
jgi:hypothetical protein